MESEGAEKMEGMTLIARKVDAPRAIILRRLGQCSGVTASGRRPSIMMKTTRGMARL